MDAAADPPSRTDSAAEFRRGMLAALPFMLGMIPAALVLGAQAAQKGFSVVEVPLLTGLNFAGGSEFAAVALWTSPPHILLIAAITLLINSRHILMGATLAPYLRHLPRRVAYPALFLMCDESWALALVDARRQGGFRLAHYLGLALAMYATWVGTTALGGVIGPVFGDPRVWGLDMAFPAIFLVLLRGFWTGAAAARPWLASLGAAIAAHLLLPGAWYVAVGALAGLATAFVLAGGEA
jgi:4-azaleucine resistance transporter AzlC